jgi:E3 ubiquitin-protein ligase ZNRF1/2
MGGRLTSPPSSASSSSTTAHRNTGTGSTTNLSHPRTHSNSTTQHSQHPRHRSNSGHHNSHGLFGQNPSNHNRHRTTSTNLDPTSPAFNFNLLRYVGLEHESADQSSDDDSPHTRRRLQRILIALRDVPCPVCNKTIPSDSFDKHILHCLSKPRIDYNEDTLTENKGECVICLDDLLEGQKIARLPCLCIYHKSCIDNWFRINRSCPEHPGD